MTHAEWWQKTGLQHAMDGCELETVVRLAWEAAVTECMFAAALVRDHLVGAATDKSRADNPGGALLDLVKRDGVMLAMASIEKRTGKSG
jgi:hypothetical protein